jgi:hypothetical protein
MDETLAMFVVTLGLSALLALPACLKEPSWKRYLTGLFLSAFGVMVPLFFFLVSAWMVPDSKAGCRNGWLDCFYLGKLALSPLVLWASAALYSAEIYRVDNPTASWIVSGYFLGTVVSVVCLASGLLTSGNEEFLLLFLLVPAYVVAWYTIRWALLVQSAKSLAVCIKASLVSLPFWAISLLWSRSHYQSLPQSSACFVVTAAARGHRRFVGPFATVVRRGRCVEANRQLMTMWDFEKWWQAHAPRSHACFRRFYNRVGPMVARQIGSRWTADLVYLVLKPLEIGAGLAVRRAENRPMPRGYGTGTSRPRPYIPQVSQIEQWVRVEGPRKGQAL